MGRINIWIVLLLASVLLNGVLIGAAARDGFGTAAAPEAQDRGERRTGRAPRGGFDLRGFVEALPDDVRADTRARFDAVRPELRSLGRDAYLARRTAMAALGAEGFEVEAAATALGDARRARSELEAATERVVLEAVADLDAETRREALRAALGPRALRRADRSGPAPEPEG
ncbi:periplasmic heavy metal sensor [Maricaulaceae bacterium MS644]